MNTFIIFIFLLVNCSKGNEQVNLIEKNSANFFKYKLNVESKTNLEENDSIILFAITDSKISSNGNDLLICDNVSRNFLIYDFQSGNLKATKKAGMYIQDNLASTYPFQVKDWKEQNMTFLKSSEYKNNGIPENLISTMITSYFGSILNDGYDNYELLTYLTIPAKYDEFQKNQILNLPINVKLSNNFKDLETISFYNFDRNNKQYFPKTDEGIKIKDSYYISSFNQDYLVNSSKQTNVTQESYKLITISKHAANGNFIKEAGSIPEFYCDSELFYNFLIPFMVNINDTLFVAYCYDNKIYCEDDIEVAEYKQLPFNNKDSIKSFIKYKNSLEKDINFQANLYNNINRYYRTTVISLFKRNNNLLVVHKVFKDIDNNDYYLLVQEYSTKGKLISNSVIEDNNESDLHSIAYNEEKDILCIIRKNKQGWFMEKRSFK